MGALNKYRNIDVWHPEVDVWNGVIEEVGRRLCRVLVVDGDPEPFPHPWMTTVSLWSQDDERSVWRVDVRSGAVNDLPAVMVYAREGDARGWVMPKDYPAPKQGEKGFHPEVVDRLLCEVDDAPFLLVEAPSVEGESPVWERVVDARRPEWYRTAVMWERDLFATNLYVSADPLMGQRYDPRVRYLLPRHRVFLSKTLPQVPGRAGSARRLATVYLSRDKKLGHVADECGVEQEVFWDLQSLLLQPGGQVIDVLQTIEDGSGGFWDVWASSLDEGLRDLAYVAWWTV